MCMHTGEGGGGEVTNNFHQGVKSNSVKRYLRKTRKENK